MKQFHYLALAVFLFVFASSPALSQSIGVFSDPACTNTDINAPIGVPVTIYISVVNANLLPTGGFIGAEFKVEGLPAGQYTTVSVPVPGALSIGNPFGAGTGIFLFGCNSAPCVLLYTVTLTNISDAVGNHTLSVVKHDNPIIPGVTCSNVGLCDFATQLCIVGGFACVNPTTGCIFPTPVELTEFTADRAGKNVLLSWQTASETNNSGFEIQRSSDGRNWKKLDFMEGHGTTDRPQHYSYTDFHPAPGHNYYRLNQIDYDGQSELSEVVQILVADDEIGMLQVYPNPNSGAFKVDLYNPGQRRAIVKLFDGTGKVIWQDQFNEGEMPEYWTQNFDLPQRKVYFLMTQMGEKVEVKKITTIDTD